MDEANQDKRKKKKRILIWFLLMAGIGSCTFVAWFVDLNKTHSLNSITESSSSDQSSQISLNNVRNTNDIKLVESTQAQMQTKFHSENSKELNSSQLASKLSLHENVPLKNTYEQNKGPRNLRQSDLQYKNQQQAESVQSYGEPNAKLFPSYTDNSVDIVISDNAISSESNYSPTQNGELQDSLHPLKDMIWIDPIALKIQSLWSTSKDQNLDNSFNKLVLNDYSKNRKTNVNSHPKIQLEWISSMNRWNSNLRVNSTENSISDRFIHDIAGHSHSLLATVPIYKSFNVYSGASIRNLYQWVEYDTIYHISEFQKQAILAIKVGYYNQDTSQLKADGSQRYKVKKSVHHYISHQILSIPVGFGYSWKFNKFELISRAGVNVDFGIQSSGYFILNDTMIQKLSSNFSPTKFSAGLSGSLSSRISYPIYKQISINASLQYHRNFSYYRSQGPLQFKPSILEVGIGLVCPISIRRENSNRRLHN
ncbi:MAG TPA: hypothetical protein PK006_13600 [Saprospiraceae bacterium]|nr:hypothetical protein [Saprospiraceae bacterium]